MKFVSDWRPFPMPSLIFPLQVVPKAKGLKTLEWFKNLQSISKHPKFPWFWWILARNPHTTLLSRVMQNYVIQEGACIQQWVFKMCYSTWKVCTWGHVGSGDVWEAGPPLPFSALLRSIEDTVLDLQAPRDLLPAGSQLQHYKVHRTVSSSKQCSEFATVS